MQDIIIYKRIEKWTSRPGVVAVATLLNRETNGVYETDIRCVNEAIFIANKIIQALKIWEYHYNKLIMDTPTEIRDFLWNTDKIDFKPVLHSATWRTDVTNFANDYEKLLMVDRPGKSAMDTLEYIRGEVLHHERFVNEMKNANYYPIIP